MVLKRHSSLRSLIQYNLTRGGGCESVQVWPNSLPSTEVVSEGLACVRVNVVKGLFRKLHDVVQLIKGAKEKKG